MQFKLTPSFLAVLKDLSALCSSGLVLMFYLLKFPLAAELVGVIKHFLTSSSVTVAGKKKKKQMMVNSCMWLSLQAADVFRPRKASVVAPGEGSRHAGQDGAEQSLSPAGAEGLCRRPPSCPAVRCSRREAASPSPPLLPPSLQGSPPACAIGLHV